MENISIRKVGKKDAEFLFNLMNNEAILKSLNEDTTSLNIWQQAIPEWDNDTDEEDYIISDNNIPIDWLAVNNLTAQDKQAFIKMIALLPNNQGHGIGKYAINRLIRNLKLRGYESIILYTDRDNIIAQKCYQKCGFVITDNLIHEMSNGKIVKRLKMELKLNQ